MKKRIFDCFMFFNELEILNIRLRELHAHVDGFVLCESTTTFQGQKKELIFEKNKNLFGPYLDKIIHVIVDDMPTSGSPWSREHFQRNALRRGLPSDIAPQDVVIISDADEILRDSTIEELRLRDGYFMIEMPMYHFFLNTLAASNWNKVFAFSWMLIDELPDLSGARVRQDETFARLGKKAYKISSGGWHFTFIGGAEKIREKLKSYSHTGGAYDEMLTPGVVEKVLLTGNKVGTTLDSVGPIDITRIVEIDDSFPSSVRKDVPYYRKIGFIKDVWERVRELEGIYLSAERRARGLESDYRKLLGKVAGITRYANELVKPYAMPEYSRVSFAKENLIPASKSFSRAWTPGTQKNRAVPTIEVPRLDTESIVLRHERDDPIRHEDNNLGWWTLANLVSAVNYTASCYIWLPAEFGGREVGVYLERFSPLFAQVANLNIKDRWQRISHTATCPSDLTVGIVSLRISGYRHEVFYSTCWQVEIGADLTPYVATDVGHKGP